MVNIVKEATNATTYVTFDPPKATPSDELDPVNSLPVDCNNSTNMYTVGTHIVTCSATYDGLTSLLPLYITVGKYPGVIYSNVGRHVYGNAT